MHPPMSYIDPLRTYSKSGIEVLLRNAHEKDAGAIMKIKAGILSEKVFMLREEDEANLNEESERSEIAEHLESEGSVYIVAEISEEVVGFLEFMNGSLKRTKHSGMFSVYITGEFRGNGIGRLLLEMLIHWAEKHMLIEKVTLAVFSTNAAAIGLYEKMGFKIEGICPRDMKLSDGSYIDSVLMYRFVK